MDEKLYLSAEEAAEALGVSVTTVYAYVSRKLLRSHKPPGARAARYWRADVERMRRKLPPPSRTADALVTTTQITVMTDAGPFYRGRSAVQLAQSATLESVAAWLWRADEAKIFPPVAPEASQTIGGLWPSLEGLSAVDKALALFPLIERENPRAHDLSPAGFARTAGEAMRWFAAIVVDAERPSAAPLHEVLASRSDNPGAMSEIARCLMVLSAYHELDPTTYAVRAVANAGVNPYRLLLAGLITSTGRRLAYGRSQAVTRFLEEVCATAAPGDVVIGRLKDGEAIPGFGSPIYPHGDPRATTLLAAVDHHLPEDEDVRRLHLAIDTVRELTSLEPDFGMVNLFLGRKFGLAKQGGIILRLGRMAGWMAHAMEQFHEHELVRPHAPYVGPLPDLGAG